MLNSFSAAWNNLYTKHPSEYKTGGVTITEKDIEAKNKSLTVVCDEVVSFPSKQFDCYDLFSALTNCNCDSVLLIKNEEESYDSKTRKTCGQSFSSYLMIVWISAGNCINMAK